MATQGEDRVFVLSGLTKRELFAALALQGILAGQLAQQANKPLPELAVEAADSLIEALNKPPKQTQ
ncbi:MAG: hypothetical protein K6T35_05470 [Meiothermus silvanus]|nr:hypothetical protein [Allomeiothermus silvanus]